MNSDPLHQWLKAMHTTDVAHYVIWRRGNELRTECQTQLDLRQATPARSGIRLCETCQAGVKSRKKHYAAKRKQPTRS